MSAETNKYVDRSDRSRHTTLDLTTSQAQTLNVHGDPSVSPFPRPPRTLPRGNARTEPSQPDQNDPVTLIIFNILLGHEGVGHGAIPVALRRQYQGMGVVR